MGNDWFHEYFINELKAIGRKPTSNMQHEVVDSLPSSGNEQTIYFVKNDSSSSNNHYDEYVWISSSSTFEKIGSTQIDGSATQPDWNQNDATQPDYVKNRPFYTGDPVETVLIEETTAPFADSGSGYYMAEVTSTFEATDGEIYKVSWDGAVYECTYATVNGLPAIGNLAIINMGPDTGEPFIIGIENDQGIFIFTADASASHTFSISRIVAPVVKINPKYLPVYIQITEEKIPHDCLDVAVGYTYNTRKEEVYNSGELTVTDNYYDSSQFYCALPNTLPEFIVGDYYRINFAGKNISNIQPSNDGFTWNDENGSNWGIGYSGSQARIFGPNSGDTAIPFTTTLIITHQSKEVNVPIEDRFIPDTIARRTELVTDNHINELIDAKLGVIENGSY